MNDLDDLFDREDPEFQAALVVVRKHIEYHEDHPDQCPHNAIVAAVARSGIEQPGFCLDCKASPVMERETDCPLCKEEKSVEG